MMHQTYNDGNIAITSQVANNGNDGIIAIKSKDGATIEELRFSMLEEKRLIKNGNFKPKMVFFDVQRVKNRACPTRYGTMCL